VSHGVGSAQCDQNSLTRSRKARQGKKQINFVSDGVINWGGHRSVMRRKRVRILCDFAALREPWGWFGAM
jgi:hypothetical protein